MLTAAVFGSATYGKTSPKAFVGVDPVAGGQRVDELAGLRRALERLQRDVDDVVGEPAAVREALQVAAEHAEPVRAAPSTGTDMFSRSISDGTNASGHVGVVQTAS